MKFEIAVEAETDLLLELCLALGVPPEAVEETGIPVTGKTGSPGRLVFEEKEGDVDPRLQVLSRAMDRIERKRGTKGAFSIGVRNRAYAEPPIGGDRPRSPFRPVPSVLIQPWHPGLDLHEAKENRALVLDPSRAFGNGRHPTTRMCLACLETLLGRLNGVQVLDFGCGTALLALAAVHLGAEGALGVERDPAAARAAERNLVLNGLEDRIRIRVGSWEAVQGSHPLVLANLVPAALLQTGGRIFEHLSPGGTAVISGFGRTRMEEMEAFFAETGLAPERRMRLDAWGALVMRRPA